MSPQFAKTLLLHYNIIVCLSHAVKRLAELSFVEQVFEDLGLTGFRSYTLTSLCSVSEGLVFVLLFLNLGSSKTVSFKTMQFTLNSALQRHKKAVALCLTDEVSAIPYLSRVRVARVVDRRLANLTNVCSNDLRKS